MRTPREPKGERQVVAGGDSPATASPLLHDLTSEVVLATLLELAPDATVIVDGTGRILLVNAQTERLFGYGRDELQGQLVEILISDRFRTLHRQHRARYAADPRVRPMGAGLNLFGCRKDGTEVPVEISLSPIVTSGGMLVSAAIRDVTDRRHQAQLLAAQAALLEAKNLELEKAIRAKDRFLATMSHELRTPLNAIIGFTGTLLMKLPGPLNADQERQLRTIQSSSRHLLSLINDLLDLAKIESGNVELRLEPISCAAVIDEVTGTLRPMADAKALSLQTAVPPADVVVNTDRRAVGQILLNLVTNAIKFTAAGSVVVELRPADAEAGPAISVIDSGIGLSAEEQARLFHAFQRMERVRQEGTGLGLYLSQKLAELLGGRIDCESAPGAGSRFTLVLPRG